MDGEVGEEYELDIAVAENVTGEDVKSVEINLQVMKMFFANTISLYEGIIKNNCNTCNIVKSEEFVNLHKNLCEFEEIFNYFEVPYDRNLINNLVKINKPRHQQQTYHQPDQQQVVVVEQQQSPSAVIENVKPVRNFKGKYPCFVNSCNLTYSTEEGAKIHFIKNHCKKGDIFEPISDDNLVVDYSKIPQDGDGRYICQYDNCTHASADRSNFRVHLKRHQDQKFCCPQCGKTFFTRDPQMIHYVRLHMKEINWANDSKDLRTLRKTIRRLTNMDTLKFTSNDEIEDVDSDLHGPVEEEETILNQYVSEAIADQNIFALEKPTHEFVTEEAITQANETEPVNSFNVSLSLRDVDFFSDSVTFKSEGGSTDINELIKKTPNFSSSINTKMALQDSKDEVVQQTIPQRTKKYKCPHDFCQQDFFTMKNLLIHLKASHDPKNPIPCPEANCAARFKSQALLAQHQKRHRVQYSCSLCPYKTHLAALMTRHNRQHAGKQLFHECNVCQQKFEYLGALSSHRKKVHNQTEPLECSWPGCDKRFKTIIGLNKHRRELHMKMKLEIICDWPDCNAMFSNRTSMTNHRRIHTNERPYQCQWQDCGKWFRLRETLKRHLKIHQGSHPFVCVFDKCDKSFGTKRSMKLHMEKVHMKNNQQGEDEEEMELE